MVAAPLPGPANPSTAVNRLDVDAVSFAYAGKQVLSNTSLTCDVGVTALLGPNGSGKTTLLRVAATSLRPREGLVSLLGPGGARIQASGRGLSRYRRSVGWLPQQFLPPPGLTALEVVAYAGWVKGLSGRQARRQAAAALATVGLGERAGDRAKKLSGGMIQRLGIAQAIVHRPRVLLLDEPTGGLDPDQRASFRALVRKLSGSAAVLLSTHITEDVDRMCRRVVVLGGGRVRFTGSLEEFRACAGPRPLEDVTRSEQAYRAVLATES